MQFLLRLLALALCGAALAGGMLAALAVFLALPHKPPQDAAPVSQPVSTLAADIAAPAPARAVSARPPSQPVELENTGMAPAQPEARPIVARTEEAAPPRHSRREARRARRHARREASRARREERRARRRALREARRDARRDPRDRWLR